MSQTKNGSDTTPKQRGGVTGKGFVKGDPRINRSGRPRHFDAFRELAIKIANEDHPETHYSNAEELLRSWKDSPEPSLQLAFAHYCFGKVPDKVHMGDIDGKPSTPMVIQVITPAAVPLNERVN